MAFRFSILYLFTFLALAPYSYAQSQDPAGFIREFSEKGISDVLAAEIPDGEKKNRFRVMFDQYFDIPHIGRFVLGRYRRLTTNEQKEQFSNMFENVIIQTWSRRFSEYDGQTLKVIATLADGKTGALVKSQIVGNNGTNIGVDWRVRNRDSQYKVVDIVVEGVSMAITYRQEYSTIIARDGGFNGLLSQMQKQISGRE